MKHSLDILSGNQFIRVFRSYIVPSHYVTVKDKEIPVGRTYRKSQGQ